MAANDPTLYVRQAIVTRLKIDVSAVASRVYGRSPPAAPVWPFIRVAVDDVEPFTAQCLRGATVNLTVHTFAKGDEDNAVALLNRTVADALSSKPLVLTDSPIPAELRRMQWLRSQIIRDTDEATGWHGIVSFQGTVSS
ncbi:MAG TPA: DUF3168 domain-containing protein [Gammaproteobacteria bacterium]|nr:DUF3168 domain-containing protein [Gammaproteobacteria bacterium]